MMVWLRWARKLWLVLLLAGAGHAAPAASSPLEVIRESNQEILDLFGENQALDAEAQSQVYEIMERVTSFETIGANAIDSHCTDVDAELCNKFKQTFVRLLQVSSVKRLGRYRADRFEYLGETIDGDKALVKTLAFYEHDQIELDYHLQLVGGEWKIIDYDVEGVGTVRNYDRQFRRLLRKESVDGVIRRLEGRIANYEKEP